MPHQIFVDPLNKDMSHSYFNSAIIKIFQSSTLDFTIISSKSLSLNIQQIIEVPKLEIIKCKNLFIRLILIFVKLIKITGFKSNNVTFLCIDNLVTPFLMVVFYFVLQKNRFTIIIHNNIESLRKNYFKRMLHRLFIKLYSAQVIVLTKQMKIEYDKSILSDSKFLPHPNYSNLIKFNKRESFCLPNKINIIVLGRQAKLLQENLFAYDLNLFTNINFIIVSTVLEKTNTNLKNVSIIRQKISFDQYFNLIATADFTLFALDSSTQYRASGILIDSISLGCPIIAPNLGHFLEYKRFNIGYTYNSYYDMYKCLDFINNNKIRKGHFSNNLKCAVDYSRIGKLIVN